MKFDVEGYIRDNLDGVKEGSTGQLSAICPWCGKPDHFYVDIETGHYICHRCDERGRRLIGLVAWVEGLTYSEAGSFMMRRAIQFRRKRTLPNLVEVIRGLRPNIGNDDGSVDGELVEAPLPPEYKAVWRNGQFWMPKYLKQRGIKKVTAKTWELGYADRGRYAGRVIIPIECPNGRSFTSRDTTGEQHPKYLNPPGADHGRLLLGWKHADLRADIVLVEGPLDIIKVWQHGLRGYALSGKVLHPEQLVLLFQKPASAAVTLMLDPEEATAPYEAASKLTAHFERVYIAKLPEGVDPGKSTKQQAHAAYNDAKRFKGARSARLAAKLAKSRMELDKFR